MENPDSVWVFFFGDYVFAPRNVSRWAKTPLWNDGFTRFLQNRVCIYTVFLSFENTLLYAWRFYNWVKLSANGLEMGTVSRDNNCEWNRGVYPRFSFVNVPFCSCKNLGLNVLGRLFYLSENLLEVGAIITEDVVAFLCHRRRITVYSFFITLC